MRSCLDTNPRRQRGKQVTSALPREVFASLALRVSIFCGGFVAGDDRKSKMRNFKKRERGIVPHSFPR